MFPECLVLTLALLGVEASKRVSTGAAILTHPGGVFGGKKGRRGDSVGRAWLHLVVLASISKLMGITCLTFLISFSRTKLPFSCVLGIGSLILKLQPTLSSYSAIDTCNISPRTHVLPHLHQMTICDLNIL